MKIAAGQFKARCLALMDEVREKHRTYTITKRGVPVARLVPVKADAATPVFGHLRGHARIDGDVVASTGEVWDAEK